MFEGVLAERVNMNGEVESGIGELHMKELSAVLVKEETSKHDDCVVQVPSAVIANRIRNLNPPPEHYYST